MGSMAELVGILNVTPDSFSDGGQHDSAELAVEHAEELFADGASIVDIGAESTRPGADALTWQEEVARLDGVIAVASERDWQVSLDTYHPETVKWASERLGRFIINDVTAFRDPAMREAAAETGNQVIVSHLPLASKDIQSAHKDKPVVAEGQVINELYESAEKIIAAGVRRTDIIVDPGIGFGKSLDLNWRLLEFGQHMPGFDVMIGYSRKRFLGENRMETDVNLLAGKIAIAAGANYLRVHDVKSHARLL